MISAYETEVPKPPRGRMAVLAVLALLFVVGAYSAAFGTLTFSLRALEYDLVPFYCGGDVVLRHADPYRTEPLRSCERRVATTFRKGSPFVVPAPQPAYVLAAMSAFARMPYPYLQVFWAALELAAFVFSVGLLSRLLALSPWIVCAALGFSDFISSAVLGQFAAFCVFGIVLVAWGIRKQKPVAVGVGLALVALEPHVALPLFLAMAVWGTRAQRIATILTGSTLVAVSLAVMPLSTLHEYASTVLATHALSEVANEDQLSATYAMHELGFAPAVALAIAKWQYVVFVALSLASAGVLARRYDRSMLAFAPPAFAVFGGPFLHVTQVGAAIPAALALFAFTQSRRYVVALALLCVPWLNFELVLTGLPIAAACLAAIARYAGGLNARATWTIALLATVAEGAIAFTIAQGNAYGIPRYGTILPSDLAETTWKIVIDQQRHGHVLLSNLAKIPTAFALALVLAGLAFPAFSAIAARRRSNANAAANATPFHPSR